MTVSERRDASTAFGGLATKFVTPIAASAASAAAGYLAKAGSRYVEETLIPRIREARETGNGSRAAGAPAVENETETGARPGPERPAAANPVANDERERRRRERAAGRAARRKAPTS